MHEIEFHPTRHPFDHDDEEAIIFKDEDTDEDEDIDVDGETESVKLNSRIQTTNPIPTNSTVVVALLSGTTITN